MKRGSKLTTNQKTKKNEPVSLKIGKKQKNYKAD